MMIATVTLNPSLDYIVFPARYELGKINRYDGCTYAPGGKGINVSLMLSSLGLRNRALGVAAGFTGREIARMLEEAGCETDLFFLPEGSSRINMKVHVPGGEETGLNGNGPAMAPAVLDRLAEKFSFLQPGDALVLAGSVPTTLPRDAYARLLRRVEEGVLTVVDACGESLLASLPFRPFLVKPNLDELEELFGASLPDLPAIREAAKKLRQMGAQNVLVSLGERGALLSTEDKDLFCHTLRGETVSTVGAGDSMVAGFLYGLQLHGTPEGALTWGVAAGAATAFSHAIASGEEVKRLYPQVEAPHLL